MSQQMNGHDPAEAAENALVHVEDLDTFVRMLTSWHERKIALLRHLMKVPEGTEVMVGEDTPRKLEGDFRDGYLLGLGMAITEVMQLPFQVEFEVITPDAKVEADPNQPPPGNGTGNGH